MPAEAAQPARHPKARRRKTILEAPRRARPQIPRSRLPRGTKPALTTLSPQPSYIRGWGLTSGFDCPKAVTFAFFRIFPGCACVGGPLETFVSLFPQTMVSFRLHLASVALKSVFGTIRVFVSLCVSQSQKVVGAVFLVHRTHLFLSVCIVLYGLRFVNTFL